MRSRTKQEWKQIGDFCKDNWPEETSHILRVADEVCRNHFLFDLKWDMERTYEPVIFEKEIDWGYMPGNDPEFVYQFNRHRYFICLGQAYQLTGDEKYTTHFLRILLGWIRTVKRNEKTESREWRILEAGLRSENWIKAMKYFINSPLITESILKEFYNSLKEHAEYIIEMHSPYRYMSNWGVLENHGLFMIGAVYPDHETGAYYMESAMSYLLTEAHIQIMPDGAQWEQSPMYHNEVLHCFLEVAFICMEIGKEIPKKLLDTIYKMAYANLKWMKPNHHQPLTGDSDDTDIRDMLTSCAYLFKDTTLKFGGYEQLDYDSAWELGMEAINEYDKLPVTTPDFTSIALEHSGNYYMRSSWEEDAAFLHFHNGTLGAGHGHSDKLHVDLVYAGEDVLIDAGRYTYVAGPDRFFFKDPNMHNTITVDNQFFCICKDSWECTKLTQPVKQGFYSDECYDFVQGGHLGYMDLKEGVFVNRKVIFIKPDIYIIVDEMYSGGRHEYQQYFHFNESGEIHQEGTQKLTYKGVKAEAEFYFLTSGIKVEKMHSMISRHYNQRKDNPAVNIRKTGDGFTSLITVIYGGKKGNLGNFDVKHVPVQSALKGSIYPEQKAEGIKLTRDGKEYVVIICHQEVNTPTDLVQVDDNYGYGSVIVFDEKNGPLRGTVLCW